VIEAIETQHKAVRQYFWFVRLKRPWPAGRIDVLSKQKNYSQLTVLKQLLVFKLNLKTYLKNKYHK